MRRGCCVPTMRTALGMRSVTVIGVGKELTVGHSSDMVTETAGAFVMGCRADVCEEPTHLCGMLFAFRGGTSAALACACVGFVVRGFPVAPIVSQSGNGSLFNDDGATDGAMLAFGLTRCGAGGCNGGIGYFGVTLCGDIFRFGRLAVRAGVGFYACCRTSGRRCYRATVPSVSEGLAVATGAGSLVIGCVNFAIGVTVGCGCKIRRAGHVRLHIGQSFVPT